MTRQTFAPMVRTWFPDEVFNVLQSVVLANGDLADAIDTPEMALYRRGFDAAIAAIAASFGIEAPQRAGREVRR